MEENKKEVEAEKREEEARKKAEEAEKLKEAKEAAKHEEDMQELCAKAQRDEPLTASEHAALRRWAGLSPLPSSLWLDAGDSASSSSKRERKKQRRKRRRRARRRISSSTTRSPPLLDGWVSTRCSLGRRISSFSVCVS